MGTNVTFDPTIDTIIVTTAPVLEGSEWVVDLDIKVDVFSDGKEDWIVEEDLNKRRFPVSTAGGDELPGSKQLGSTFFLEHGWKIRPYEASHTLRVNGNIYSRDGSSPFIQTVGSYNVMVINTVSSLVDSTVQQLTEIEYASFNGGVSYNKDSPYSGTDYPTGTPQQPVNNIYDAKSIGIERGFVVGYITGDLELPDDIEVEGFTFIGAGKGRTTIYIPDLADVTDCTYNDAHVVGTLDGDSKLEDCLITDLTYIKGYIEGCVLSAGTTQLGGGGIAHFLDCYSGVPGTGTAILDMGGSGQGLAMRNYNGGILITNKTGTDKVSIDLNSGQVKLDLDGSYGDAGLTNGQMVVRGSGKVIDATTGDYLPSGDYNGFILLNETVGTDSFSAAKYNGKVYIEIGSGHTGNSAPVGLIGIPADNLSVAQVILNKYNLSEYHFHSTATISSGFNLQGYKVTSHSSHITFESGCLTSEISIIGTTVLGVLSGHNQSILQSSLIDLSGICGNIEMCVLSGDLYISGNSIFRECIVPQNNPVTVHTGSNAVNMPDIRGFCTIADMTGGTVNIGFRGGALTIDYSCVAGTIFIDNVGNGVITDNSDIGCTVIVKEFSTNSILGSDTNPYHDTDSLAGAAIHLKHLTYKIYVDADASDPCDGSQHHPFNNQNDAIDYAESHGIKELVSYSDIQVTNNLKNFVITGVGTPKIEFIGIPDLKRSEFNHIKLTGEYTDSITAQDSFLMGPVTINGIFETCAVQNELIIPDGGMASLISCFPLQSTNVKPILDVGGVSGTATAVFMGYKGGLNIMNCTQATDVVKLNIEGGIIDIDASCVAGFIMIIGTGIVTTDNSSGSCVVNTDNLINPKSVTKAVMTYDGTY